jgi:hypothetical protein
LESIYDLETPAEDGQWYLDMRAGDPETTQKIEEEKKKDEEVHTEQDEKVKLIANTIIQVDDIEKKR